MKKTFTADEKTASAMALAFLKWQYRQTRTILTYSIVLIVFIVLGFQQRLSVFSILLAAFVISVTPLLIYRRLRKLFYKHMAKPGFVTSVNLTRETLTITTPQGNSTTQFNVYESIDIQDSFVILKSKSKIGFVLPRQLLPDDAIAQIKARIVSYPKQQGEA